MPHHPVLQRKRCRGTIIRHFFLGFWDFLGLSLLRFSAFPHWCELFSGSGGGRGGVAMVEGVKCSRLPQ